MQHTWFALRKILNWRCAFSNIRTAWSVVHPLTQSGDQVTLSPDVTPVDISTAFRSNGQRVASLSALSGILARANAMTALDAAEMGFAMTQGVGMVSFMRGDDK